MPDLDLIKQVEQGDASGSARPIRLSRAGRRRLQPTGAVLVLICCRRSKRRAEKRSAFRRFARNRISAISAGSTALLFGHVVRCPGR